jgi:hypothetical protein
MPQFLDHLTDDVLPALLDGLSAEKVGGAGIRRFPSVPVPRHGDCRLSPVLPIKRIFLLTKGV